LDRSKAEGVVKTRGWLGHQSGAFQDAVLQRAALVDFSARDYVFHVGDDPGGVYGVATGGIGVYVASRNSTLSLGHVLRGGHWFGHGPAMLRRSRTLTYRATEASSAFLLPLAALNEIASRDVESMRSLGTMADFGLETSIAANSDLLIRRSDQRIAATLLRVTGADDGVPPSDQSGYCLTQAELAEMTNVSLDVMHRTLARFKNEGWIAISYNRIAILKVNALSEFLAGRRPRGGQSAVCPSSIERSICSNARSRSSRLIHNEFGISLWQWSPRLMTSTSNFTSTRLASMRLSGTSRTTRPR
jgi:CRP/FNR family transcriptional regulator, cyclic AMP receptor protein